MYGVRLRLFYFCYVFVCMLLQGRQVEVPCNIRGVCPYNITQGLWSHGIT
jgi:hypothetical protein